MLYIRRVDTLDDAMLDIELSNGHLILFSMKPLLEENPTYAPLRGRVPFPCPKNEGQRLHWQNGPILSLEEILAYLAAQTEVDRE